jgi:hypothetical protein
VSRIRKAYKARFRAALRQLGARQGEKGVALLLAFVARTSAARDLPLNNALARLDARLRWQVERFEARRHPPRLPARSGAPRRFLCDAGLGGLARWLRAAGYEALWLPDLDDAALLREAQARGATLLTTDSLLLERRVICDGGIPTVWLPPAGRPPEQLARVFRELKLAPLAPRCMQCGGKLRLVDKATVAARIPPRTARWLEEYFVCAQCGHLFWRGTHWQRINACLRELSATMPA